MDSELSRIYIGIGAGISLCALLIYSYTGMAYTKTLFIVLIAIGLILSFLGGGLLSWGKSYQPQNFFICLFIFCIAPIAFASLMHYYIIATLKTHGLLTPLNVLLFFSSITLLVIYIKYYEKYNWKTYYIQEEQQLDIDILSSKLLGTKPYLYDSWFRHKAYLFNLDRVNDKKKRWDSMDYQSVGMPNGLRITYFSTKEQQLYQAEFTFSKQKIRHLMGLGLLFPLNRLQKYNHINMLFFTKGDLTLQLGNEKNDINFFDGVCTPITAEKLSTQETRNFEKSNIDHQSNTLENNITTTENLKLLRKQKINIRHTITGLTKKIKSISVITTNGERYVLNRKNWNGNILSKTQAPIAIINLIIINNKGQKLSWEYVYNIDDIASHFKINNTKQVTTLDYKFDLFSTTDHLLRASSFEYINGEKNEFKLDKTTIKIIK